MKLEPDFLESYDPQSIALELRRIAAITGKTSVSRADINRYGRLDGKTVQNRFGTFRQANEAAGLFPGRFTKATNEELLRFLIELWEITLTEENRSPMAHDLARQGFRATPSIYVLRFGSWRKALAEAARLNDSTLAYPSHPEQSEPPTLPVRLAARPPISVRKRFLVFKRDQYTCQICKARGGILEADHIIPIFHGGSDRLDNLQTLCQACNQGKNKDLQ